MIEFIPELKPEMPIIFILDDDMDILFVMDCWLTRHGYEVYTFGNSFDLIDTMKNYTPDLVILDVWLGEEKDGKSLCSEIKQQHHFFNPIYLFSASPIQDIDLLNCGAEGFIAKPFDLQELLDTLNKALSY
jgi:DNA-binding response OmpR family regulator